MKRIAILSSFPPRECGIGRYACSYAEALEKNGAYVRVYSFKGHEYGGKAVAVLEKDNPLSYWNAARQIAKGNFDQVIIEHEYSLYNPVFFPKMLLWLKMMGQNTTLVLHTVAPEKNAAVTAYIVAMHTTAALACNRIVVHTNHAKQRFEKTTLARGKVEVVPIPIPQERKTPKKMDPKRVELLCFGFMTPAKGTDLALEAVEGMENAHLTIAGGLYPKPKKKHIDFREKVLAKAAKMANVTAIGRFVTEQEKQALFTKADFVVLPYRQIDQSAVLAQAWAGGRIPICSDIPPLKEEVGRDEYGVLFRDGDAGDLRKTIGAIVRDGKRRNAIGRNIAGLVKRRSFRQLTKRFLEFC